MFSMTDYYICTDKRKWCSEYWRIGFVSLFHRCTNVPLTDVHFGNLDVVFLSSVWNRTYRQCLVSQSHHLSWYISYYCLVKQTRSQVSEMHHMVLWLPHQVNLCNCNTIRKLLIMWPYYKLYICIFVLFY